GVSIAFVASCAAAPVVSRSAATMVIHPVRITASCPLPKKLFARGMVRPVDLRVAVDATASDHPVARGGELRAVVDRRGVPAADVAALAEHRLLGDQHAVVVRAVRIVAAGAALAPGRVIVQERPALLGVAAGA